MTGVNLKSGGGCIVDSGSTFLNAHSDVAEALVNNFVCNSPTCPQKVFIEDLACYLYN